MKNIEYIGNLLEDCGLFTGPVDHKVLCLPSDTDPDTVLKAAFGNTMTRQRISEVIAENKGMLDPTGELEDLIEAVILLVRELCEDPLGDFSPYSNRKRYT